MPRRGRHRHPSCHRHHRHHGRHAHHGGPYGYRHRGHPWQRRRGTLRRRLTILFALVALVAVVLTTWMTVGAVFEAQRELFQQADSPSGPAASVSPGGQETFEPAWPPWRRGDVDRGPAAQAFRRITGTAFGAALLSFFLAVIAAGVFTNFLTRPLRALTQGARRLEAGERGIRLRVPQARDELRSLTEAFNGLVSGLERQESWRRNLTADIAHDLRTPLAVMRSEIEGMQDGVVANDAAGLARLHGEVMLLARLVDDLKTLSESEGGALSLHSSETAIEPLLRRSVESFSSRAAEAGATLRLLPVEPGLSASVDPDRIVQVIGNLLDNALRYAGPVKVEVGAAPVEDEEGATSVRLWVRDHGPGLPAGAQEQVFERFYRGDAARSRTVSSGSGLGLAIAKAIIEAHGGTIMAFNHPEGGALFEIELTGD